MKRPIGIGGNLDFKRGVDGSHCLDQRPGTAGVSLD